MSGQVEMMGMAGWVWQSGCGRMVMLAGSVWQGGKVRMGRTTVVVHCEVEV